MNNDAVIYIRVSTQEQAEEGVSLQDQEARLLAYCQMMKLEVKAVIREGGVSAYKPLIERPGGAELIEYERSHAVQHVVALKLDRLFRNAADCLVQTGLWDRAGVTLHLVEMGGMSINTASAMGRMFLTMAAGFAELERNLCSERTKAAMAYLKSQGVQLGAPRMEDCATIAFVYELAAAGHTNRSIASLLEQKGFKTLRGGKWASAHISRLLRRRGKVTA
jgi:site-specific DNA recombinase